MKSLPSHLALAFAATALASACAAANDPTHGRLIFQQSCAVCHSAGLDGQPVTGQGPLLAGVVGRRAASLPNFGYSRALVSSGLTWDDATLDHFLAAPGALVPGTTMVVSLPNPDDRSDLIAFLGTLKRTAVAARTASASHAATPGDWENDAPGVIHQVVLADLPAPYATTSAGNSPHTSDRPAGAALSVPEGFQIRQIAADLSGPRLLRTAPNGDIFIAETRTGQIRVIRLAADGNTLAQNSVFADGLEAPFGIAFYPVTGEPQWIYVGNVNSVVRIPYRSGDLKARGEAQTVVPRLAQGTGGHSTRDVAFSLDGKRLFISVGSGSNVAEGMQTKSASDVSAWESARIQGAAWGDEANRANILATDPEGTMGLKPYAVGIRNPVGIAVQQGTGQLWCSTNERDGLGDDLVPDYVTHVQEGGFYGWPWYYMGNHEDPRHARERPDLAGKALVPDVPEQSHSASLQMTFYPETLSGSGVFPKEYQGDAFVAFHGSWNRSGRTGSKVVRILLKNGVATGKYQDFVTGFVIDDSHVWGRPVGVTIALDGSLLFTDDANNTLWRVSRSDH